MYFIYFTILLGIVPITLYRLAAKGKADDLKALVPFLWLVFAASLYEFFITGMLQVGSHYWFWINKILGFYSIHYFFYRLLDKRYPNLYRSFNLAFALFFLVLFYFEFSKVTLVGSSYLMVVQAAVIYIYAILWFVRLFKGISGETVLDYPVLLVVSGFLIFYSGNVVLYLLADTLLRLEGESFLEYWMLNVYLNFIFRTMLIIAIWKRKAI